MSYANLPRVCFALALFAAGAAALTIIPAASHADTAPDAPLSAALNVRDFGAKGDGAADDTAAFQKALDAAAKAGGATVFAPRGNYLFAGHLNVPPAVTLAGLWNYAPAHAGIRDPGQTKPTEDGTTFLPTENAGKEEAAPFITLNTNSTLKGVVIYYPKQKEDDIPAPYPWTVVMRGNNPALIDCELLNPYKGIDASNNQRHLVRNVHGQPLRMGMWVDAIYDIGRVENVHFNPWWSMKPKLFDWQMANGEAFVFARSDWEYVLNTFCYGYKVGYKFAESKTGSCNGNFLGIGADYCQTAVVIEQSEIYGLLITNGEFVSVKGPDPTMIAVEATNKGVARFVNCAFWGECNQIARIDGSGTVGLSDCTFVHWGGKDGKRAAIQARGGTLLVRGCEFMQDRPQIQIDEGVTRAVIAENIFTGAARIANRSKGSVQIGLNAAGPKQQKQQ
ncbi:MAG: glycosyl hydrolase family 28-related protein [bacterium]|nr:glycosyl hydrolase family 28-related protein [Candidatus Sumerlaeota bacterium]